MRGRKKGTYKTGGRKAGVQNRTTKEAKKFLELMMFGQLDNMNDALNTLYKKDQRNYLDACSKLFTYVLPKKTDITTDDKPIAQLPIILLKKHE
jgi:hypothetical protein